MHPPPYTPMEQAMLAIHRSILMDQMDKTDPAPYPDTIIARYAEPNFLEIESIGEEDTMATPIVPSVATMIDMYWVVRRGLRCWDENDPHCDLCVDTVGARQYCDLLLTLRAVE
jgi:hypothetical protein